VGLGFEGRDGGGGFVCLDGGGEETRFGCRVANVGGDESGNVLIGFGDIDIGDESGDVLVGFGDIGLDDVEVGDADIGGDDIEVV
jgi:hypothetical protein